MAGAAQATLPSGVGMTPLQLHDDDRGGLVELFRTAWDIGPEPVQWNVVHSRENVFRGFHVHAQHTDYLVVVSGRMVLGLKDIRRESPTFGRASLIELTGRQPAAVFIPPGVGHGFYFPEPSVHIYGVSHYWAIEDELGCVWNDAELGIDWPVQAPVLSQRDRTAASFDQMVEDYRRQSAAAQK